MNEDVKKYLPLGAGLLGVAGIYALMRAPVWGPKAFAPLRKEFGNKATLILSKETEGVRPTLSKILSGFDKTIVADSAKIIPPSHMKGMILDLRPTALSSSAHIKPTLMSLTSKQYPGVIMEAFAGQSKIFPETKTLKAIDDKFLESPSALKNYILDATRGTEVSGTILKPGVMASGLSKTYKTTDVINNPEEFFNVLKSLQSRDQGKLTPRLGEVNTAFYLQKEYPGETYRATMINDRVVPGSVTKRHSILGSIFEKLTGSGKDVEKRLDELVKNKIPFKSPSREMFNSDFQVLRDASGNISDIKIIDLNWNGAAGNIVPGTNPIGSWALSRALTGKQPRILAASAGAGAGTGTYFLTRKKKKSS